MSQGGRGAQVFEALVERSPLSLHLIDSSFVRTHQHAAGGKYGPDHALGRSRGGLTTKIQAVVGEAGLPMRLLIAPGQSADKTAVPALLDGLPVAPQLSAARGYDSDAVLALAQAGDWTICIPSPRTRRVRRSVPLELYPAETSSSAFSEGSSSSDASQLAPTDSPASTTPASFSPLFGCVCDRFNTRVIEDACLRLSCAPSLQITPSLPAVSSSRSHTRRSPPVALSKEAKSWRRALGYQSGVLAMAAPC